MSRESFACSKSRNTPIDGVDVVAKPNYICLERPNLGCIHYWLSKQNGDTKDKGCNKLGLSSNQ